MAKSSSIERLRFCNFKLRVILEITEAINQNKETSYLLKLYEETVTEKLGIERFILISNIFGKWDIILYAGINIYEIVDLDIERDLFPLKDIEITIGEKKILPNIDFVVPIFKQDSVIAYVLMGDINNEKIGLSPTIAHLQFIQTLTNIILVAIQNKELLKASIEQERLKRELETASQIQSSLIPNTEKLPNWPNIKIKTFYLPHYEVGGDLFDVGVINEDEFYFCIADVSGKGISAAMIMANFQANLRAFFRMNFKLEQIVHELNKIINEMTEGYRFVTMFIAKYHIKKQKLLYINAGHIRPIVYDYGQKAITFLDKGCHGIGMLEDIENIELGEFRIKNRTKILCLTDGLTEYSNFGIEDYGYFVSQELMLNERLDIEQTIDLLVQKLPLTKDNSLIFDDVSLIGLEILPSSPKKIIPFR